MGKEYGSKYGIWRFLWKSNTCFDAQAKVFCQRLHIGDLHCAFLWWEMCIYFNVAESWIMGCSSWYKYGGEDFELWELAGYDGGVVVCWVNRGRGVCGAMCYDLRGDKLCTQDRQERVSSLEQTRNRRVQTKINVDAAYRW